MNSCLQASNVERSTSWPERRTHLVDKDLRDGPLAVFLSNVGLDVGTLVDLIQP